MMNRDSLPVRLFGVLWRQRNHALLEVDLLSSKIENFAAPQARIISCPNDKFIPFRTHPSDQMHVTQRKVNLSLPRFFFSSRRRHTRYLGDWSSDVCSSDLMGGYQLMIAADIFRGRYRQGNARARPITPDTPLLYRFALPTANHVFRPGHRIMVQIQSSWLDRKSVV